MTGRPPARPRGGSTRVLVYHDEAGRYAELVRAPRGRVTVHPARTRREADGLIAETDVLLGWRFPRELYAKAGRLRWVQSAGAGVEWAIVPELPRSVVLTRAPGVFGPWMAEYVLGWCAWVTQKMRAYRDAQARRQWIDSVLPDRLAGKTMTIVGMGDIGRVVAHAARSFGMRVLGVSRSGRAVPEADRVYRTTALTRAVASADFVVLVLPLTDDTQGLIDGAVLAALRPEAWLINIGRGPVLDEPSLVNALRAGRLAGAILDVFDREPLPADHPFWTMSNVVVTPHISGPSTPEEIAPIFNENLARFLAGRPLRHVVDPARGY